MSHRGTLPYRAASFRPLSATPRWHSLTNPPPPPPPNSSSGVLCYSYPTPSVSLSISGNVFRRLGYSYPTPSVSLSIPGDVFRRLGYSYPTPSVSLSIPGNVFRRPESSGLPRSLLPLSMLSVTSVLLACRAFVSLLTPPPPPAAGAVLVPPRYLYTYTVSRSPEVRLSSMSRRLGFVLLGTSRPSVGQQCTRS